MLECCIVFSHFRDDETTRAHLELLRRLNPYPVVAVCRRPESCVEGAVDVGLLSGAYACDSAWGQCDSMLYLWFRHGGLRAERYLYLEWDTYATVPVREFYDEVWDADAAGSRVVRLDRGDDWWHWFRQVDRLPEPVRPFACGITPFNGVLLSHRALCAAAAEEPGPDVFCELRLGSLVRAHGFEPVELPPAKARTNSFNPAALPEDTSRPWIYHPVKRPPGAAGA